MPDPSVSPADTIRHAFDSSLTYSEHVAVCDAAEDALAELLAVGERDKAEIERMTEQLNEADNRVATQAGRAHSLTAEVIKMESERERDGRQIARLTEALREIKLTTKSGSHVHAVARDALDGAKHEPFRAVLAGEEDTANG